VYVAGSRNNLTADVTLRFDRTGFDLSEIDLPDPVVVPAEPEIDNSIGVDGESFSANSASVIGRLSYSIELSDELAFVPTGGVSLTRTKGNDVNIGSGTTGGVLTLDDYSSNVLFLGGTLARTRINPDGTSASTLFVSGNYYNDLADDRTARFVPNDPAGITENITLDNLGGFGELSLGWNYVKILENGLAGARQLNTSLRVDSRFGANVSESYSLTAQVRLTF
jgi:fibronectin-binding autotransporter adhesin